jgi:GT2 family glycosyltransferase/glycosyltransferase involved in cell wall biosynthesis
VKAKEPELRALAVSVVVVNFRGADDTIACVRHLQELDWPADQLEIIVVENGSGDASAEKIRSAVGSAVRLVESDVNGGFTGGCNLGAAAATGEYLAFLNNDARPDPAWIRTAVAALRSDSTIGCVASKVLDWDGVNVDYIDAALTWYGMGYKPAAGAPYDGSAEQPHDVLFATGSAMITRTQLFRDLGGFDERFFMFYEDVDLGWRMNLFGHRVRYVPDSVVFHKHHASIDKFGSFRERFLLERNALMTLYKNAEQATLDRSLAPAIALAIRRGLAVGGADPDVLDLQRNPFGDSEPDLTLSKDALAPTFAVDSFVAQLPSLAETRKDLQRRRVVRDHQLAGLMGVFLEPAIPNARYLEGHAALVDAFGIGALFTTGTRVLVVTGDPLAARMAGPAIRAFNMAVQLSADHDVRLVSTQSCSLTHPAFDCRQRTYEQLRDDVAWAEVVVFQGFLLLRAPWLADTDRVLVVDLYDPMHVEQLEQTRGGTLIGRERNVASTVEVLNSQLRRGDFFLCASEIQRHFWLGQLAAMGRLNSQTYDRDPTLRSLVDVAPFGIPEDPPQPGGTAVRGVVPGISKDDKLVIWGGGIYDWFDPLTLIEAVGRLSATRPDLRLYFMGTAHPSSDVPEMSMVTRARQLADALGLTDRVVFFNDGWVDYTRRGDYLLEADVGVSTHALHLETELSYRTRVLDYLWAGLPIVATEGDTFADIIATHELGRVVPEGDVDALADALEQCLYDATFGVRCRDNVARLRPDFAWSHALEPLVEFCRYPHRAADAVVAGAEQPGRVTVAARLRRDAGLVRQHLAEGGLRLAVSRAGGRIKRMARPAPRR